MNLQETLEFVNNPVLGLEGEIWKEHPVYSGYYGSNYGRIKNGMTEKRTSNNGVPVVQNVTPRIKVQHKKNKVEDTLMITIDRGFHDRHYVYCSRFVCECFYGLSGERCIHKNGIVYDNRIANMMWGNVGNNEVKKKSKRKYVIADDEPVGNWVGYRGSDRCFVSRSGKVKKIDKDGNVFVTYGWLNGYGYFQMGRGVHRMIAETFIPNPDGKHEVNHIDGNPSNNRVENLEWCSRRENMISPDVHNKISRKVASVDPETKEIVREYISIRDAVREIKGSFYAIKNACVSGDKKYKDYYWKFI